MRAPLLAATALVAAACATAPPAPPAGVAAPEVSLAGRAPRALDGAALDAFLERALVDLEVPGAAVAVVQGGRVIHQRVLGVRERGEPAPVTAQTLFLIGSVTKPITTLMEAALVDRGALGWDTPLTTLWPGFAVGDPERTARLLLWHTACGCSGMPRRDLEHLMEYGSVTAEQRMASLRTMAPTAPLGETFQYSNLMAAAGGFAAARALHPDLPLLAAYARALQAQVLDPIGMRRSTFDFAVVSATDHARPHALDLDGRTQVLPLDIERNVLPIAPAGAMWSTVEDLALYALTELGRGRAPGGAQVASAAAVEERWQPRTGDARDGYGLGIGVEVRAGLRVIGHDGGSLGFGTTLALYPDLDLGVVVLTNVRNGAGAQLPFNAAVEQRVVELLFAEAPEEASAQVAAAVRERAERAAGAREGLEAVPDAAWLAAIAGTYAQTGTVAAAPGVGEVTLRGDVLDAGEWRVRFTRRTPEAGATATELVIVDAPFAGVPLAVGGDAAQPTITLPDPHTVYLLERLR